MHIVLVFYGVDNKKDYISSVVLFWPRKDKEGHLKAEDVTACKKYYSHSVHDNGGNTSNLLSHVKAHHPILHGFVKLERQNSLRFVKN